MNLFYYDNLMASFEKKLDFLPVINHLENLFQTDGKPEYLTTLIADSWYYAVEGDVNQNPINYDCETFIQKWKSTTI